MSQTDVTAGNQTGICVLYTFHISHIIFPQATLWEPTKKFDILLIVPPRYISQLYSSQYTKVGKNATKYWCIKTKCWSTCLLRRLIYSAGQSCGKAFVFCYKNHYHCRQLIIYPTAAHEVPLNDLSHILPRCWSTSYLDCLLSQGNFSRYPQITSKYTKYTRVGHTNTPTSGTENRTRDLCVANSIVTGRPQRPFILLIPVA